MIYPCSVSKKKYMQKYAFFMWSIPVHIAVLEQFYHNSLKQMRAGHLKSKPTGKMFPKRMKKALANKVKYFMYNKTTFCGTFIIIIWNDLLFRNSNRFIWNQAGLLTVPEVGKYATLSHVATKTHEAVKLRLGKYWFMSCVACVRTLPEVYWWYETTPFPRLSRSVQKPAMRSFPPAGNWYGL